MKKLIILFTLAALILCGCEKQPHSPAIETTQSVADVPENEAASIPDASEMFTDRDRRTEYDSTPVQITLNGSSADAASNLVTIDGSTVTIKGEGTYALSGQLDGMVIVDAQKTDKLQLVLEGASISSTSSAAIYVRQADKVFITLAQGTENSLSTGERFEAIDDNNIDGAIFSQDDLTFNGTGSLTVTCPGGHGIVGKDDLVFTGGSYNIQSAGHGIDANDSVRITGSTMNITAGKDGIHSENSEDSTLGYVYIPDGTYTLDTQGDGISAGSTLQIADGSFAITTGGGAVNGTKASSESYGEFMGKPGGMGGFGGRGMESVTDTTDSTSIKGLKAAGDLMIGGGSFTLDCADDAVHSNSNLTVADGSFQIKTGDDGLHADEALHISGGMFTVEESYEGVEGLNIIISGGDLHMTCSDDGINAAGGTDSSGFGGGRGDMFGGRPGGMGGGMGGMQAGGNGSISITGGSIYISASGDGIDANGTLEISGGQVTVCGPTRGDTAVLDYDSSATITGGTFIGTGASNMAQSFSGATQGVLALYTGNCTAGTQLTVTDPKGNVVLQYAPELDFGLLILSTPDMTTGETYTVTVNGESYDFQAG